jgi:voltage-gated sodium channel
MLRRQLARFLADPRTEPVLIGLIIVNALTLGLETSPTAMEMAGPLLVSIDRAILAIFVLELAARLYVHRLAFFRDPWSLFDLVVVGVALIPATGSLSVLRALRVLRLLRLVTLIPSLRRVVGGLVSALPGMGSILLLLVLIFYVFAVMGTKLFGGTSPEQFGSLGSTAYTLFQVMTFDDWSAGVVKPLAERHPYAIAYFLLFILLSTFMALNLFIGVIVSALDEQVEGPGPHLGSDPALREAVEALRQEVAALRAERLLDAREPAANSSAA